jgi:predicted lipid-binding transport protein (Tim44 family)
MKRLWTVLLAAFLAAGLVLTDAEAKRLGGGKSLGMQRDQVIKRDAAPSQTPAAPSQNAAAPARPGTAAPAPASGMSRWLGPVAGLAAGLGLAALFSHLGLGEGFGTFVMLLLLIAGAVFLFRMLRRRTQAPSSPLQYAGVGREPTAAPAYAPSAAMPGAAGAAPTQPVASIPAGFDAEGFLRHAKLNFLRLQAAHDAGNLEDIREFTTPEMFAEIRLDLQDRGASAQQTDVVTLNAELLDVSEEGQRYLASVRFHGAIRETKDAAPAPFDEVWHLAKPKAGGGWVIAGIQQVS